MVYKRSYFTILDALSYIGGIFNALLALFIFMSIYGEVFFEMFFAKVYFRANEVRSFGFVSFIQQMIFTMLKMIKCKPDWDLTEKRYKIR